MKKTFLSVLSSLIIICIFSISSFAAFSGLSVQADKSDDKNLVVVIGFDESGSICGGNFTFSYNSDKLTLSDYYTQSSGYTAEINPNYNNSGNSVRCSFFSATPIQNGKNLAILKFKIKSDNVVSDDLNLNDYRLYNENAELVSDNVKNPVVISINSIASEDMSQLVENITGSDFTNYSGNTSSAGEQVSATNAEGSVVNNNSDFSNEYTTENNNSGDYSTDFSAVTDKAVSLQVNSANKNRKSKIVLAVSLIISVVAIGIVAIVVTVINKKKK